MNNQELSDQLMKQLERVERLEYQLRRAYNNQITNDYGAFLGPAIAKIEPFIQTFEHHVRNLCKELEPFEVRLLAAYLHTAISATTGEIQLRKALNMRKREREDRNSP